ncbi:MAG TPA: tryptophan synthase subunit beta, partial [Eubacteriaceae bacterium]|nr:tryptophan synthase subunit beta [Eubacteriaceae bacterium]
LKQTGKLPELLIACVGGGSNAMGLFHPFVDDETVKMIGVEAAGEGVDTPRHAATLSKGSPGIIHGMMTYILQDDYGQILPAHSVSAGLDYPGVGPEHAYFHDSKRVEYGSVTDEEALEAFGLLSKLEGIIPALESAHALAYLPKMIHQTKEEDLIVVNVSGRGDKDVYQVAEQVGGIKNGE